MPEKYFSSPSVLTAMPLLAAFVLALFFHGTQDIEYAPLVAAICTAGFLLLIHGLKGGWAFPRSVTAWLMAAWWAFLFIALQGSEAPYISTYFFIIFSIVPFLFFALVMAREPLRSCAVHAAVILAGIAVLAVWALAQFFFLYGEYGPRIRYPLMDPNSLAGILNMGLLSALALFMTAKGRRGAVFAGALCGLLWAALVVTQSRAGMAAAIVSAAILLPLLARPLKGHGGKLSTLLLLAPGVPILLELYSDIAYSRDLARAVFSGAGVSIVDRGALWHAAAAMIRDHFWRGTGLATFPYLYSAYRLPSDHSDGYFTHMDPLQFWVEMGAGAPVLFYALMTAILIRTARAIKKTKNIRTRAQILGPFCALLALLLHTHLNYHLYMPALLVPAAVFLAYWYVATESALGAARHSFSPKRTGVRFSAAAAGCYILSLAALWSAGAAIATHYTAQAEMHLAQALPDEARKDMIAATRWAPRSKAQIPQYEAKWRTMKLRRDEDLLVAQKQKLYGDALAFLDEAQRRQPSLENIYNDRAKLYFVAQEEGLAADGKALAIPELQKVLRMNPLNLDARTGLARIYMGEGEMKKALAVLDDGLHWPRPKGQPDLDYLVMTARLHKQTGDEKMHDALINEALERAKRYGLTRPAADRGRE